MTVLDIFETLNRLAPVETALDFDNPGFLVGERDQTVTKVLVALDITEKIVDEAVSLGAELIVAHHPIIFSPLRCVTDETPVGRVVRALIRNNISAICMHTNLDMAQGGVNDCLAAALGLSNVTMPEDAPMMRIGTVEEQPLCEFLKRMTNALDTDGVRYRGEKSVHKVGLVGGSAGEFAPAAIALGCDTFITGEVKHHQWLEAAEYNLIEGGHFATENVVCHALCEQIKSAHPSLSVSVAEQNTRPERYFTR